MSKVLVKILSAVQSGEIMKPTENYPHDKRLMLLENRNTRGEKKKRQSSETDMLSTNGSVRHVHDPCFPTVFRLL